MSVIANVPEEEEIMNEKYRYAIVGCKASGKTAIGAGLQQAFIEKYGNNYSVQYLTSSLSDFKNYHGVDIDVLRHVYSEANEEYWIRKIHDKINPMCDLIIVDDIRYKCEMQYLREIGFKIVFLDTDWMIRLERLVQMHKTEGQHSIKLQSIKWFYSESELQMEKLPASFYDFKLKLKASDSEEKRREKITKLYEELLATRV